MRTICISTILFAASLSISAQSFCGGIYSKVSDYQNKHISIPLNCQYGKKAVQISNFFLKPYVYIKVDNGITKIPEDSIYAVQDCNGNVTRIYKRNEYQLIDAGEVQIYSHSYMGEVKKIAPRGTRTEERRMTDYYFSINDSAKIMLLTISNISFALSANIKLDKILRSLFPNDLSLQTKTNNKFEINNFLSTYRAKN